MTRSNSFPVLRHLRRSAVATGIVLALASGGVHAQQGGGESTMIKLIRGLMDSGALTPEAGQALLLEAQRDAAASTTASTAAGTAQAGDVRASVLMSDLQALALEAATLGAKQQGVAIQELQLSLASDGPRAVTAHVRVKAKKMMMSGVIHLRGRLSIDERLNATVSQLSCVGEGMVGNAAAAMLQKKVQEFEGRTIALTAFSLGDVALRDLQIQVDNAVRVTAAFGSR